MSPALSIDHLDVRFGDVSAVSDVSLHLGEGSVTGFVGPNGAGKTTTMRAVFGLVEPSAGSLTWDGRPIGPEHRRTFGYMPEERGLYAKMRVHDQLRYFGRLHGMSSGDAGRAATATIERLGIEEYADRPLTTLSLGNQQRVQLGVSLMHRPPLLVLDEPFSGLDPMGVEVMAGALAEERDRGATILFSSHQLELVERLSDRVAILLRGALAAQGTLDELRAGDAERRFVVEAPGAPHDWWRGVAHVRLLDDGPPPAGGGPGPLRFVAERAGAERELLRAAEATGQLVAFSPDRPSLARIFRDLVA